jgi:hypothetical protein
MTRLVLLDSGPLGLASNPRAREPTRRCNEWLQSMLDANVRVMVPEIADYEVRRELLRAGRPKGIAILDYLGETLGFLGITRAVWLRAARLWAESRAGGLPTADTAALDGDVILAAQAQLAAESGFDVLVATDNAAHLGRFVDARTWETITAG